MWIRNGAKGEPWHQYKAIVGDEESFEHYVCGRKLRPAEPDELEGRETSEETPPGVNICKACYDPETFGGVHA